MPTLQTLPPFLSQSRSFISMHIHLSICPITMSLNVFYPYSFSHSFSRWSTRTNGRLSCRISCWRRQGPQPAERRSARSRRARGRRPRCRGLRRAVWVARAPVRAQLSWAARACARARAGQPVCRLMSSVWAMHLIPHQPKPPLTTCSTLALPLTRLSGQ